jgi:hypothetical protein
MLKLESASNELLSCFGLLNGLIGSYLFEMERFSFAEESKILFKKPNMNLLDFLPWFERKKKLSILHS